MAICLIADCLNGSQPSDLRLALGLLVRQLSLAFLNCLRLLAWVSLMIFFPEGKPSQATLDKLEAELESLTSLDISIEILAGRMIF